jgi:hypothetical protein
MPYFIDYHENKTVWQDAHHTDTMGVLMKQIIVDIKAKKADAAGVRYINILMANDGHGACLSEAPDAEAVLASHEARGFPIQAREVHKIVKSLTEVVPIRNVPGD